MSRDFFHDAVVRALEKEGWAITDDPLFFRVGGVDFKIDLGAERVIGAEKNEEKIAVEIKTFIGQSVVSAFHLAIGQYENYLFALEEIKSDRMLYLAVPESIWDDFFQRPFVEKVIQVKKVNVIVYDPTKEEILKWIK
ncbi:MAG: XisH family protein [Phaeodactylibacter sp.]|nr:XisH family protein [Phaeodactylibacter sp.]